MKRRKLALVMAAAMVLTSVPANGFVGYAEELPAEVLELEASGGEEIMLEDALSEETGSELSAALDGAAGGAAGSDAAVGEVTAPEIPAEGTVLDEAAAGDGEILIESITELDAAEELSGLEELTAEDIPELQAEDTLAAMADGSTNGSVAEVDGKKVATAAPGETVEVTVKPEDSLVLSVDTQGFENTEGLTYRWEDTDGQSIDGATGKSYEVSQLRRGTYYCHVSGRVDGGEWVYFSVKVDSGLEIVSSSMWGEAELGGSATMSINATVKEGERPSYTWYVKNYESRQYDKVDETDTNLSVETDEAGSRLTLANLQHGMEGHCEIRDSYGIVDDYGWNVTVDTFTLENEGMTIPVLVEKGKSATLSAVVNSVLEGVALTYRWDSVNEKGEYTAIENATESTLSLQNVEKHTRYCCTVSDGYIQKCVLFDVSVDSGLTASAVDGPREVEPGEELTLQVQATVNEGEPHYKWYNGNGANSDPIPGMEAASCTVQPTKSGYWTCRVSDEYGYYKEITFWVKVRSLTVEGVEGDGGTQYITVKPGESGHLSVNAFTTADGEIAYQWFVVDKNTLQYQEIPGATKNFYDTGNISESTLYWCKVRDQNENKSIYFDVSVNSGLTASAVNVSHELKAGEKATLQVQAAVNDGEVHYKWYEGNGANGDLIPSEEAASCTVQPTKSGNWTCRVSDDYGNYKDVSFWVIVHSLTVEGSDIPEYITVKIGEGRRLSVNASTAVDGGITYQWSILDKNTNQYQDIPEAKEAFYDTGDMSEDRSYCCWVRDQNESKQVFFVVMVDSGLTVEEYTEVSVLPGESAVLRVNASTDAETLSYQWYRIVTDKGWEKVQIDGATSETYKTPGITGYCTYICDVTDGCGKKEARFEVDIESGLTCERLNGPQFLIKPGQKVTLKVSASSKYSSVTYEWYACPKYGEDAESVRIENASDSTLTVEPDQSMSYYCYAKDKYETSDAWFEVDIDSGLRINSATGEWVEETVDESGHYVVVAEEGKDVTLTLDASSDLGKVTYRWSGLDDQADGTGSSLVLKNISKPGWYECDIFDGYQQTYVNFEIVFKTGFTAAAEAAKIEVESGADATLRVIASTGENYGPVTYTWFRHCGEETDTSMSYDYIELGETGSSLTVKNITDAQFYRCEVRDKWNSAKIDFVISPKGVLDSLANSFESAKTLTEGTTQNALIRIPGDTAYFRFVPGRSGVYTVVSLGEEDTFGYLYDAQRNCLMTNDEGPVDSNFKLEYELQAGNTYYIAARIYSDSRLGEFRVLATYKGAGEAEEHQWDAGTVTQAATCTEDGVRTFTCLLHGETRTEAIAALGHDYPEEWTVQKEATCTEAGSKYRVCARCGAVENETIAPKGHTFGEELSQDPTATENGMVYKECSVCHQEEVLEVLPATGVSASVSEVQTIVGSLDQEGSTSTVADAVEKITAIDNDTLVEIMDQPIGDTNPKSPMDTINALEAKLIAKDAQTGLTGKIAKSSVSANPDDQTVISDQVQVEGAAVTVASVLKSGTTIQPDADTTYRAQLLIKEDTNAPAEDENGKKVYALDISMDIVAVKAGGTGSAETVQMDVQPAAPIRITMPVPEAFQGAEFTLYHTVDGTDVPVSYTKNADGTISFYAASLSPWQLVLEKCADNAHKYEKEISVEGTTKAATCTATGVRVVECIVCGDQKIEQVSMTPHKWGEWTTTSAANCTDKGSRTHGCTNEGCTATETQELPPLGHDLETIVDQKETCGTAGSQHKECRRCGYTCEAVWITPTGAHTMKTVVDQAATCGAAGSQHSECAVCGYKEAATAIPATGAHTMKTVVDKAATCGTAGSQHAECTACGYKEAATAIPATGRHTFGNWATTQDATVFADGISGRSCTVCGAQETTRIAKLTPTITLNATSLPLKVKQSTTKLKVSGLAAGDSVVSWQSSNQKIVKVNASGKITAQKKTGKAVITITLASGLQANVQVKVQKGTVKTSKITNIVKKLTLKKGETAKLEPIITPITTKDKISYKTSNKKVATVSKKGVITAKGSGKAKITVKSGSKKVVVTVTVAKTAPTGITGVKDAITLKKGKSTTLKPKLAPKGAEAKIKYSSSNKKIATVNAKGKVTAKKKGTAVITITAGTIKKTCTITVK